MEFHHYLGIDWSGREDYTAGQSQDFPIQIARVDHATRILELVDAHRKHNPRWKTTRWSRTSAVEWLHQFTLNAKRQGERLLIGLDFAFGFPFTESSLFFAGLSEPRLTSWTELAQAIKSQVCDDFLPEGFIKATSFRPYFKWPKYHGIRHEARLRCTETCEFPSGIKPTSVFHLIGANQVGRGSVAGIACLLYLRELLGDDLFLWPFDGSEPTAKATAVIVEIWPRLFYELIGVPSGSHRYPLVFELALQQCGIANADVFEPRGEPKGENSGDALISAAALLRFACDKSFWSAPTQLSSEQYKREGWIWGARTSESQG